MCANTLSEFRQWQQELNSEFARRLGIAGRPLAPIAVERITSIDRGTYLEEKYKLDVGEQVQTPMYILTPKREPPFKPILVFHGHDASAEFMLGNYPDSATAQEQSAVENNYAQALAIAGYLVCAIGQRGLGERTTGQISDETPLRSCRHLAFEYLLQGRTLLGD